MERKSVVSDHKSTGLGGADVATDARAQAFKRSSFMSELDFDCAIDEMSMDPDGVFRSGLSPVVSVSVPNTRGYEQLLTNFGYPSDKGGHDLSFPIFFSSTRGSHRQGTLRRGPKDYYICPYYKERYDGEETGATMRSLSHYVCSRFGICYCRLVSYLSFTVCSVKGKFCLRTAALNQPTLWVDSTLLWNYGRTFSEFLGMFSFIKYYHYTSNYTFYRQQTCCFFDFGGLSLYESWLILVAKEFVEPVRLPLTCYPVASDIYEANEYGTVRGRAGAWKNPLEEYTPAVPLTEDDYLWAIYNLISKVYRAVFGHDNDIEMEVLTRRIHKYMIH